MTSEQIDALWTIDDPAAGFARLQEALRDNPDSADELHTQICRTLGLQRRFDEGRAELAKVSPNPSETVKVRVQLESGRLKNSSGDKAGAIPYFQRALELATEYHLDFFAVDAAHMLAIATQGDESLQWNERALQMAEASANPLARRWKGSLLNNLGWTYHDAGNLDEALRKFRAALDFQQEFGNPVRTRIARWAVARCYRSMGRFEEALLIQEELIKEPEAGYVSEELGENFLALNRLEEAKPHFRRAHELLSEDPFLKANEFARLQRLKDLAG
jgi:tetratricopeptide (TPR) repeat protein